MAKQLLGKEVVAALNERIIAKAEALKEGLIIITAGADVIRMVPPLVIEKEHVDEMITKLKNVLDRM